MTPEARARVDEFLAWLARERGGIGLPTCNMLEWLMLADESNPGVKAKIGRMHRAMLGREDGAEERIRLALEAVEYTFGVVMPGFPPWGSLLDYVEKCDREGRDPADAAMRYGNALHHVGLTDCGARVTNALALSLARSLASSPRPGRPPAGERPRSRTVHDDRAELLSVLLGHDVTAAMAKKCRRSRSR